MYLNNYDTYLVYLVSGHKVEGSFSNLANPVLLEGIHPSVYLEFMTLDAVLHLSRGDIKYIDVISDMEEVDYGFEEEGAELQEVVYEKETPEAPRTYTRVYSLLLQDIKSLERQGITPTYTLYGKVGERVEVPLNLQTKEPRRAQHNYYKFHMGAFNRGTLAGGSKVHPTSGTVIVALNTAYSNKHKPTQISGYLEALPQTYGPHGYVLKKVGKDGMLNAEAYAAEYKPAVLEGTPQERRDLHQMILTPELYNISNVQPEILFSRYSVKYGYDKTGSACKRALRRPRSVKRPATQDALRYVIPDKDIPEIEHVFAHHLLAIDAPGIVDEYKVYAGLLEVMGLHNGVKVMDGITKYIMGRRDVTVYVAGVVKGTFADLYNNIRKKANTNNTHIFVGFNVTDSIPLPHIIIKDLHNL